MYLVKWENGTVSVIAARNRVELFDEMDQLGSPKGCEFIKVKSGYFDFDYCNFDEMQKGLKEDADCDFGEVSFCGDIAELIEEYPKGWQRFSDEEHDKLLHETCGI